MELYSGLKEGFCKVTFAELELAEGSELRIYIGYVYVRVCLLLGRMSHIVVFGLNEPIQRWVWRIVRLPSDLLHKFLSSSLVQAPPSTALPDGTVSEGK